MDPDSLKETCIPRHANRLTSALTHSSVPLYKSRIDQANLFDLFEDLPFNREAMFVEYIHNFKWYVEPCSGKSGNSFICYPPENCRVVAVAKISRDNISNHLLGSVQDWECYLIVDGVSKNQFWLRLQRKILC